MKKNNPSRYRTKTKPDGSKVTGSNDTAFAWLAPYQFKPGQSGNPTGPRVGLVNEIKKLTGGGMEMAHVMIRIMRGERIPGVLGAPTYSHVQEAATWLAAQAFGTAPLKVNSDDSTYDLQRLLYVELSGRKDEPNVFDISDEKLLKQGLEDQQPLQDPEQESGHFKV